MKAFVHLTLAAAALVAALPASAQFAKTEDAIKYRKSAFTLMGAHFGRIGAMVQGKAPFDAKVAAENADLLVTLGKLPWAAFGEGTDKGDTRAKPEIWKEQAKFREEADKMQAELQKLAQSAKTGNLDAIKTSFGAAAQTCKACHDSYRSK